MQNNSWTAVRRGLIIWKTYVPYGIEIIQKRLLLCSVYIFPVWYTLEKKFCTSWLFFYLL